MKQIVCTILCCLHLAAVSICTYIASLAIESILVTVWIVIATSTAALVAAIVNKRLLLSLALVFTPVIALTLFVLENTVLHLGPTQAALPFCIVFFVNQGFSTVAILIELSRLLAVDQRPLFQTSTLMLILSSIAFSMFFAVSKLLLPSDENSLAYVAWGLLGISIVGIFMVIGQAVHNRRTRKAA